MKDKFNEDYYMRGPETGLSNYSNYRWLPDMTLPMADALNRFLKIRPQETILDYGCARGFLVKALVLRGIDAYGYDISSWAIDNCDPEIKDRVGHTLKENYDYVFCKDVLEHIPDEELFDLLPRLFQATKKASLFIVPLAVCENGPYIGPADEKDATHIQRKTLAGWTELLTKYSKEFIVFSSLNIPVLKLSVKDYPGSAGFIYCLRF